MPRPSGDGVRPDSAMSIGVDAPILGGVDEPVPESVQRERPRCIPTVWCSSSAAARTALAGRRIDVVESPPRFRPPVGVQRKVKGVSEATRVSFSGLRTK